MESALAKPSTWLEGLERDSKLLLVWAEDGLGGDRWVDLQDDDSFMNS